ASHQERDGVGSNLPALLRLLAVQFEAGFVQVSDKPLANIVPIQREYHIGGQEAELGAAVEDLAVILYPREALLAHQRLHGIGELDFVARALGLVGEQAEYLG